MWRQALSHLEDWHAKGQKPLVLMGARQVGKTHLLKHFGAHHFDQTHYINFELQPEFRQIFVQDLDPRRILQDLALSLNVEIRENGDLLIFDEIQACPKALSSLKYFCENMPKLRICAAGSLLGVTPGSSSYPVGKIELLHLHPMTFVEFLSAMDEQQLVHFVQEVTLKSVIPEPVHARLFTLFKQYLCTGGLPEVIKTYRDNNSSLHLQLERVRELQSTLLQSYAADIAKNSGKMNSMHIDRVWQDVPRQLMRTQNSSAPKFKFKGVIPGKKGFRELAGPIDWLTAANLVLPCHIVERPEEPLVAYRLDNYFKLFCFDVGLLGALAHLSPASIHSYDYGSYKGYFAENFVAQEITAHTRIPLYSWRSSSSAEIEFLLQGASGILPLEVKAGFRTRSKSLGVYRERYQPEQAIILSANNILSSSNGLCRIPLYLAFRCVCARSLKIIE